MPADPAELPDDMVLTTAAARLLHAHRATVCEWQTKGVTVRGTLVQLRGEASGSRLRTSERAVAEFRRAFTAARLGQTAEQPTPAQRIRAGLRAKAMAAALLN